MRQFLLSACLLLAAALPARAAHDTLTIGIAEFPASLHPSIDALLIKNYVLGFGIRFLTTYDKDGKLICLLCSEVPGFDNGLVRREGDGLAVTIMLKRDLAWADGVPLTARDLAFTAKIGRDPNAGFSNSNAWNRASGVDVVDDHTVVIHLPRTLVSFGQWDHILPEHIEAPIYARATRPGDYINSTEFNRNPTDPGLWDGPYRITAYQTGAQIILEPNPHWTGRAPGFKRIVMRFIGDTAALQANLLSGDIDLDNNLTLDQVLALRRDHPDQFDYSFSPSLTYAHIDLQKDNPVLADPRVRRALLMTIDRDTINKRLFEGLNIPTASFVSPRNPFFDPSLKPAPFDPAGAKRLLAEAGWTPGADGICRDKDGHRLALEFLASAGFRLNELEMTVMQSQWKQDCIEVNLRFEPSRTLFGTTTKHRAFQGLVMYTWTSNVGESPRLTLGGDQIPTETNNWGGANFLAFANQQFDADIVTAETDLDPAHQRAAWSDMQHIYADALPALPLFINAIPQAVPKWLKGFAPSGTGQPFTMQAENWHAE